MLEFLQQTTAFVLSIISLMTAPLSVLGVPQMAAVGSISQEVAEPVIGGLYSAMSPSVSSVVGQRQMWLSGKPLKNAADGLIYTSFYQSSDGWVEPRPVFSVAGSRVADPSVIRDPAEVGRFRMYYSIISDADALSSTTVRLKNRIGHAHSSDGVEWIDDGIVIGQNNGIDERGGWSPSALVVGEEIWLYYSTNYPGKVNVYRTRLTFSGKHIATDPVFLDTGGHTLIEGFHVEVFVSRDIGKYVMFLNKDFTGIVRYSSDDGLRWVTVPEEKNPVIQAASSSLVAAPAVEVVSDGDGREHYNLFFAGGPISKGAFEGVYQVRGLPEAGTQIPFVDPKAKDYETWASAGTDSNSESGSRGGNMGGLLALSTLGIAAIVGFSFLTGATAVPGSVVSTATGFSFGGRIIALMPCVSPLGPSVFVTLKPAGPLLPPYTYIWTPATLTSIAPPIPSLPPRNIGQQILGRFDIPYVCFVGFYPLYGLRMQVMGISPAA